MPGTISAIPSVGECRGQVLHGLITLQMSHVDVILQDLTPLFFGRACGSSSLSFESALRLVELLRSLNIDATPVPELPALIQVLPEMDAIYTPLFKKGELESARGSDVSTRYGSPVAGLLQQYVAGRHEYWQRCKRAAIVWDWIQGLPVEEIERRYAINPFQGVVNYGDISRITENTRFHLRSAHQVIAALIVEKPE